MKWWESKNDNSFFKPSPYMRDRQTQHEKNQQTEIRNLVNKNRYALAAANRNKYPDLVDPDLPSLLASVIMSP